MSPKLSPNDMEFLDLRMRELGEALRRGLEEKLGAQLAKVESALYDRIDAVETALVETSVGGPLAGGQAPIAAGIDFPRGAPGGGADPAETALAMCRSQGARLAMLEESFARICNLVGRQDQELEMLREELRNHRKG